MKQQFLILVTILLSSYSCNKSSNQLATTDVLTFGHFYGLCANSEKCIEIYRLEKDRIYEDKNDKYPREENFYEGNYYLLPQEKFDEAKELVNLFPADLLNEPNRRIGQPDVLDQGGYYIEYNFNGIRKFWLIDKALNNVPSKYHNFLKKVEEKIGKLQ